MVNVVSLQQQNTLHTHMYCNLGRVGALQTHLYDTIVAIMIHLALCAGLFCTNRLGSSGARLSAILIWRAPHHLQCFPYWPPFLCSCVYTI